MATISVFDSMHLRKNPWADTEYGKGDIVIAQDPQGGVTEAQARQREQFAEVASRASSECSTETGMAKNVCRARYVQNNL